MYYRITNKLGRHIPKKRLFDRLRDYASQIKRMQIAWSECQDGL